jgi:hypothetical protein
MNSLFDTKSEVLMLKTLGEESISVRAARTSPLTVSELAKRSDIAVNARLP